MDTTDSVITFDERGMCDHCHNYYTNIKPHWHPDERGNAELQQIVNRIKQERKHHDYDCMIGISGGVDSS
jgi:asparagine synthetase B (glutamine-hydrolysing)